MVAAFASRSLLELLGWNVLFSLTDIDHGAIASMILHRTIHPERRVHVMGDVKKLANRQVVSKLLPGLAFIISYHDAAVIDVDQVIGIVRIDP